MSYTLASCGKVRCGASPQDRACSRESAPALCRVEAPPLKSDRGTTRAGREMRLLDVSSGYYQESCQTSGAGQDFRSDARLGGFRTPGHVFAASILGDLARPNYLSPAPPPTIGLYRSAPPGQGAEVPSNLGLVGPPGPNELKGRRSPLSTAAAPPLQRHHSGSGGWPRSQKSRVRLPHQAAVPL